MRKCVGCYDDMEIDPAHKTQGPCGGDGPRHNDDSKCNKCSNSCWRPGEFCRHQKYCVYCRDLCSVCSDDRKRERMLEKDLVGKCIKCHRDFYYEDENDKQSRSVCTICDEYCNDFKCILCDKNDTGRKTQKYCHECSKIRKMIHKKSLPEDLENSEFDIAVVYDLVNDAYHPDELVLIEKKVLQRFPLYNRFDSDNFDGKTHMIIKNLNMMEYFYGMICTEDYCGCQEHSSYYIKSVYMVPKNSTLEQCRSIIYPDIKSMVEM